MLLFLISFILVFVSSYFITSVLEPRKNVLGFFYLFLIAFAQVVITFEVLSLFTLIKEYFVLGINVLFLIASTSIWLKHKKPLWRIDLSSFKNRVINSFKLDKSLFVLYIAWLVFIISALILCILIPTSSGDGFCYHVSRAMFWSLQGSLNHFVTNDIRNLCLPINSELIYTWIFVFIKRDAFLAFPSFIGYVISIVAAFNIMGFGGFCTRKKLWALFILSSFSSVLVQASGTETDIIIAGLVLTTMFLFWHALRSGEKIPVYMASLAYALAIGTKTTSIIMIPGVGLFLLGLSIYYKSYKPLLNFLGFGVVNFLVFSSYNYVLNFIHFGNIMGPETFMVVSKNYYGFKGMVANFIKYIYMFFDFTGFKWSDYVGDNLLAARTATLTFLHLGHVKDGIYTTGYNFQRTLLEPMMGAGILGFLVYLPCLIWASLVPMFKRFRCKKNLFLFAFAMLFIINLIMISYFLAYMAFSVRFIMSFMVLSSPILVYSYLGRRNIIKYVIILFAMFYLMFVSNYLWARPMVKIVKMIKRHHSLIYVRRTVSCKDYEEPSSDYYEGCILKKNIKKILKPNNKILAFVSSGDSVFYLKTLEYEGYDIDFAILETFNPKDLKNYNVIITTSKGQASSLLSQYNERKNDYVIGKTKLIVNRKQEIPCLYNFNQEIPNGSNMAPYKVMCLINKDFTQKYNLSLIYMTGLIKPAAGEYSYFVIFQNNNNLPQTKKKLKKLKID